MAQCPKCKRNSLEYSEGKLVAWCLYSECDFSENVKDYQDYASKFEAVESPQPIIEKQQTALAAS